ncbi:hypothetical protein KIH41_07945 [Litoribacter ruber]|uniref:DUF6089 family protein n=1 Tax=Litoribacter ruber TaxID=702568 RepID=UPI001BDA8298|nr:DUF6089 family protein [Litoribacter ruber]MBT0811209.1 hypothetical protein [Litoribacter ruber]
MKRALAIFLLLLPLCLQDAFGQSLYRFKFEDPWSIAIHAGPTQYFGELYSLWKYNEGIQPDYNVAVSAKYTFGTRLRARFDLTFYQISGDDKLADPRSMRTPRNLNFRARNFEGAALVEYYLKPVKLYSHNRSFLNPYIFAGLGVSSNNPYGYYRNEWVALRPLRTEGEAYSAAVLTFPMGVGVKYKITPWVDMFLEANYRFTLTDYLDDVSAYNVSGFYEELIEDYRAGENGSEMRLIMSIRNPNFMNRFGEPDLEAIEANGGRIRRGSGLENRYDGFMTFNLGMEIYLTHDIWDNWLLRHRRRSYRYW